MLCSKTAESRARSRGVCKAGHRDEPPRKRVRFSVGELLGFGFRVCLAAAENDYIGLLPWEVEDGPWGARGCIKSFEACSASGLWHRGALGMRFDSMLIPACLG